MVKVIARAFCWREMLENGTHATIAEIAAGGARLKERGHRPRYAMILPDEATPTRMGFSESTTTYPTLLAGRERPWFNLSFTGRCTKHRAVRYVGRRAYASGYDARADSEMLSTDFSREGLIPRRRHGEWSTIPFRRVRETHRERTAKVPT